VFGPRYKPFFSSMVIWSGASGKTFSFGSGSLEFKSRFDQISHSLPTTHHRYNFEVLALAQRRGDRHRSPVTPERVLSEYNEYNSTKRLQRCIRYQGVIIWNEIPPETTNKNKKSL